jgi:hypothetical protein
LVLEALLVRLVIMLVLPEVHPVLALSVQQLAAQEELEPMDRAVCEAVLEEQVVVETST